VRLAEKSVRTKEESAGRWQRTPEKVWQRMIKRNPAGNYVFDAERAVCSQGLVHQLLMSFRRVTDGVDRIPAFGVSRYEPRIFPAIVSALSDSVTAICRSAKT
jgi:hypothetical protein